MSCLFPPVIIILMYFVVSLGHEILSLESSVTKFQASLSHPLWSCFEVLYFQLHSCL